jgi:pseudaminic acid cytidylyltransferase
LTIAIIPARGGSVRIPFKNSRRFHGKPILAYSIEAAKASGLFERIVVSTDDAIIGTYAQWYGAEVHKRAYDDGSKGTQAVTADVLRDVAWTRCEYACCIYPCAPLMLPEDLCAGVDALRDVPYVYTIGPDGVDAGQWYWGTVKAFVKGVPLDQAAFYMLPATRVCDINTMDDWNRAERLYEEMRTL